MDWVCDTCGRNKYSFDINAPIRSRCYSCEHSEMPWRHTIANEIENVFLLKISENSSQADIQDEALVHAIIERITRPGPPPAPLREPDPNVVLQVQPSLPAAHMDRYEIIEAEILREN